MTDHTNQDLMAAPLFVSNEGEISTFLEATSEDDWIDRMDGTVAVRFHRLLVPKPVAVGILRLIRERDEARQKAADWEQTARELMKTKTKVKS